LTLRYAAAAVNIIVGDEAALLEVRLMINQIGQFGRTTALAFLALMGSMIAAPSALAQSAAPEVSTPPQRELFPVTEESRAAAMTFMEVAGMSDVLDGTIPSMMRSFRPLLLRQVPGKEAEVDAIIEATIDKMRNRKQTLIEAAAEAYASELSLADLQALIAFYRTPAGQRFAERSPFITQKTMLAGQRWGQAIGAEIEAELQRELRARGLVTS
jgi:uncharacterized protein